MGLESLSMCQLRVDAVKAGVWAQAIRVRRGSRPGGCRVWFFGTGGQVVLDARFTRERACLVAALRWSRENKSLVARCTDQDLADLSVALVAAGILR